jgi:predicted dehydrogenase
VYWKGEQPQVTRGFHTALITETSHPYISNWWPEGHIIGYEHSFVHEFHHFFDAVANGKPVEPYGATFEDGYRNAVICDAIAESSASGRSVDIKY